MSVLFLLLCGIILALIIAAISSPFWRKDPTTPILVSEQAAQDQEREDLKVEREVLSHSLQELEVELAQGRLEPEDYSRLKATDERRLLHVLDRLEALKPESTAEQTPSASTPRPRTSWAAAVIPGLLVLVLSSGIYGYLHERTIPNLVDLRAQMGTDAPDPLKMVARLEARLRENPDDLQGQVMAGRSYMALERIEDAKRAWSKVLELDPRNHEGHFHLGVILVETRKFDDPEMFQTALAHFDKVIADLPTQPGVNWYRGLVLWYLKRNRETEEAWATAFKNLDPGSQDAQFVKAALAKLRAGETPF